jgi:hypothetical protein
MASRRQAFWIALGVFVALAWVAFYLSEVSILYFQNVWPEPDSKVVMCRYFHATGTYRGLLPIEEFCPRVRRITSPWPDLLESLRRHRND